MLNEKRAGDGRWFASPLSALCNVCHPAGSPFALDNFHYGGEGRKGVGVGWGVRTQDNGDNRRFQHLSQIYVGAFGVKMSINLILMFT